jgi:hypothetical protein
MAYTSDTRGLWLLQGNLEEEAYNRDLSGAGLYGRYSRFNLLTDTLTSYQGLRFRSGTSYSASSSFILASGSTYEMGMGFWWLSPGTIGYVQHSTTRLKTPVISPIVAKAQSIASAGEEVVTSGEFIVIETAASESQNRIRLALCGAGTNPTEFVDSEAYTPGLHHVFVHYVTDGTLNRARVDIDGTPGIEQIVSADLAATAAPIQINSVAFGPTSHTRSQTGGLLSHLVLLNRNCLDTDESTRMFLFGPEYIVDDDYLGRSFTHLGVSYPQPSTVTTTQLYVQGGNVYATRSDGKILKGARPIWDTEHDYEDENSLDYLNISEQSAAQGDTPAREAEWTSSGLRLEGTVVRI